MRTPSTPGEILREEYMKPYGISLSKVSDALGVSPGTVSRLINGKSALSTDMALRLAKVFGTTPMFWINMQTTHDIAVAKQDKKLDAEIQKLKPYFDKSITENREDAQIDS
jgi:addiction module antidote protein, HigA family